MDTLSVLAASVFPTIKVGDGSMFVFCNKRKKIIKILYWDRNGICLFQKRIDSGTFKWPKNAEDIQCFGVRELRWLLDGLNPAKINIKSDKYIENF